MLLMLYFINVFNAVFYAFNFVNVLDVELFEQFIFQKNLTTTLDTSINITG